MGVILISPEKRGGTFKFPNRIYEAVTGHIRNIL